LVRISAPAGPTGHAVKIASRFNIILLGVAGLALVILAYPMVHVFTPDPEVLKYGARAQWIISLAFPLYAAGMCLGAAFNGAGDTWTLTWLNFFCLWLGQILLGWILAEGFSMGPLGIFIAVPISLSVLTLWSAILFKQGRWKHQQI
jgi:Na+-driven multidrug efflux pump